MQASPAVDHLLQCVSGLNDGGIFERSVKIRANGVSTDRALISLPIEVLGTNRVKGLAELCKSLNAPDLAPLLANVDRAVSVHIGADDGVAKCYLEFAPQTAPEAGLVFLASKWSGTHTVLNHYHSVSHLPHAEKQALLTTHIPDAQAQAAALALLDLARAGDPDDEAVMLQVSEVGSARHSFDISVADAGRSVGSVIGVISDLLESLGQSAARIPAAAQSALLGHVAIGQDAAEQPFATLYYGARAL